MGLTSYRQKRSFSKTPEPTGGKPANDKLIFVIQKHDASHLHYDFRLEMEGVLKSWAVPKGPSYDPTVKRLAMMVEDHPFDYRNFEGIIPKGQYGGGTVIVWDQGTYEPAEGKFSGKKEKEKALLSQLYKGKIVFKLNGTKLKGEFALVKSSYQGENSWLLMKVQDKYAKTTDILKKDKSVISGKTIAAMEKNPDRVYGKAKAPGEKATEEKATAKKTTSEKTPAEIITANKSTAKKTATEKTSSEKTTAEKTTAEMTASEKTAAKKSAAKKTAAKKSAAKKTTSETTSKTAIPKDPKAKKSSVKTSPAKSTTKEVEPTDNDASEITNKPDTQLKKAGRTSGIVQSTASKKSQSSSNRKTFIADSIVNETKTVSGKDLKFTNLDKVYWPKEKITKRAVINYYESVAEYMMPYLTGRPQSLNRHPNGINGESFYQKNIAGKFPSWIQTHDYKNTSKEGEKKFFVCTDEASLLYLANLGCIEINPWHSRVENPENPDFCIIDLDPDTNSFEQVIETAHVVRQVLTELKVPSYPKTSGSTGMHIYIPLEAKYDYDQSRMLAELIVTFVHREIPGFTSLERSPSKRKGKIYLDFLQNRSIQTIAAPYSLRPKPGATVSMPVSWDEVKPGLAISNFTINNALRRIRDTANIFKPVLGKGINLEKVLMNFEKLSQ